MHGTKPTPRFITSQKQADDASKKRSFIIRLNNALLAQREKGQTLKKIGALNA